MKRMFGSAIDPATFLAGGAVIGILVTEWDNDHSMVRDDDDGCERDELRDAVSTGVKENDNLRELDTVVDFGIDAEAVVDIVLVAAVIASLADADAGLPLRVRLRNTVGLKLSVIRLRVALRLAVRSAVHVVL